MVLLDSKNNRICLVYAEIMFNGNVEWLYTNCGLLHYNEFAEEIIISKLTKEIYSEFSLKEGSLFTCKSESNYLGADYYTMGYIAECEDQSKKIKFDEKMNEFEAEIPIINERIEIDYIQWKIKNNVLDEWDNEFEDRIIELSNTKKYIDDKEYDIFYDITDLDNIKVTKKRSL